MALKFDDNNINDLIFRINDTNNSVNVLYYAFRIVWCRPFQYTQTQPLPDGVESFYCYRSNTNEPTAVSSEPVLISNNDTIYYNDSLYFVAEAQEGYDVYYNYGPGTNGFYVRDSVEGVSFSNLRAVLKTFNYYSSDTENPMPTGATLVCRRASSPLGHASPGVLNDGDIIYYGDTIYFEATASTGYDVTNLLYDSAQDTYEVESDVVGTDVSQVEATRITWQMTINKGDYVASFKYTTNTGSESQTFTSNQIIVQGLDYAETITITGTAQSETPFDYGPVQGGGTFSINDADSNREAETTLTCTRAYKQFIYRTGSIPIGCASLVCYRASTYQPGASVHAQINDGDTIYFGDTLYWEATASTGYDVSVEYGNSSHSLVVTDDVDGAQDSGLTVAKIKWQLVINSGNYVASFEYVSSTGTESQTFVTNQITVSGIDYDETITVTATAQSEAPYNYGPIEGDGEFSFSDANAQRVATTTLTCSRELKKFKYYTGTPPIGVASLTCYRYSSEQPGVVYGVVNNEDDIYYGDVLYWEATASTGYTVSVSHNSSNTITVTSDITGSSSAGITVTRLTWSYTVYLGTGQTEFQYKVNNGGYRYSYGDRTISDLDYDDVLTIQGTEAATGYDPDTTVYTRRYADNGGSLTISATLKTYTVTWSYQDSYGHWTSTTTNVIHGSTPTPPVTPSTVTSGSYRQYYLGWDSLSAVTGARTITATYKQQYYITFEPTRGCSCNQSSGWYDENTSSKLTVIWTALENWSFSSDGETNSATVFIYITEPKTYSYAADYLYVTIQSGTGCYANLQTGWQLYNASCTWTCYSGYAFNSGGTSTTSSVSLTTAGGTYSKSASYGYLNVTAVHCSADVGSGWRALSGNPYQVTYSADTSYAFDSSGTNAASQRFDVPYNAYGEATYFYVTVSGTNCSANKSTGWWNSNQTITWTANSGYAFTSSGGTTTSQTTSGPGTYSASTSYFYVTVNSYNCSANKSSGWWSSNQTITWTASSNYAFNSSGGSTKTQTTSGPGTYTGSPGYGWYNVTATNCTADVSSGWYPAGDSKSTAFRANSGWSFGGSSDRDYSYVSAFVPGSVSASPSYFYLTISSTNCSANKSSGFYTSAQTITWTADTAYAFNTSNSTTTSQTTSAAPGTYSANASYVKRYTLYIDVGSGGSGTVTRTSSPYAGASTGTLSNGSTIYYGDVLSGSSSPNGQSGTSWGSWGSVTTPSASASGNTITVTNNYSRSARLYYNTSNSAGGTQIGSGFISSGSSASVTLSSSTTYYCSARATVDRTGTYYTYSAYSTNYSGTNGVTGNVTATFRFSSESHTTTDQKTVYSSTVSVTTAAAQKLAAPTVELLNAQTVRIYNPNPVQVSANIQIYSENSTGDSSDEGGGVTNIGAYSTITYDTYTYYTYYVEAYVYISASGWQNNYSYDVWNEE